MFKLIVRSRVFIRCGFMDYPGGPMVKNLPANAGDMGLIPSLGRFYKLWGK